MCWGLHSVLMMGDLSSLSWVSSRRCWGLHHPSSQLFSGSRSRCEHQRTAIPLTLHFFYSKPWRNASRNSQLVPIHIIHMILSGARDFVSIFLSLTFRSGSFCPLRSLCGYFFQLIYVLLHRSASVPLFRSVSLSQCPLSLSQCSL